LLITISGLPGSGTTTMSRLVAEALGLDRLPGGEVFRQMAAEAGMTLAEFGRHAKDHPEHDRELDRRLLERAREGDVVIESRLAGWLATRGAVPAVRVWVSCAAEERARRVGARDAVDVATALADNATREALERARYLDLYDIDLTDLSIYDLVLESTAEPPEPLAEQVVDAARARFG
jgi:CMP/dCMP kinase